MKPSIVFISVLLSTALLINACNQALSIIKVPVSKKIIEFGWDKPLPSQLSSATLEQSIFDGLTFRSSAGDKAIASEQLPVQSFDLDIAALQKIKSKKLANSFYLLLSNSSTWDWFDDNSWAAAEQNLYQHARVAKQGGLRGIMFDPEVYQFDLWAYASQPQKSAHNFQEFETQMRKRGAQTMRAFERAYPGITILSLYSFGAFEIPQNATYQTAHASLEQDGSLGLYAAFTEGMLEAASDQAVLIDGNESSYYFLRPRDFDAARVHALTDAQVFVAPALRAKFTRQFKLSSAMFLDGTMNFFNSARFFGYYLQNDTERRNLITHNVYHGLRSSDEFVWVYSETPNWWKRSLPNGDLPALATAIKRGKLEYHSNKPLSQDSSAAVSTAETAFKARVDVGGDTLGLKGLSISFGSLGNNCATWANAQRWSCTMPNNSSFTVVPTAPGVTFEPASITFTNLTKSNWSLKFQAKTK
jgi:hypothetical protein